MTEASSVRIKGIRGGLLVTLEASDEWQTAQEQLLERIKGQGEFFRGAEITLQVGDRVLDNEDIRKLKDKLAAHDVKLQALLGTSPETLRAARRNNLETEPPDMDVTGEYPRDFEELPPINSNEDTAEAVLFKSTLRSGRVIRHVGHVIVIGDVNPGAQIIAGGDIVVWGRMRGTVHAGANGDEKAVVCALDMRPTQLRIANHVAIAPDDGKRRPNPEVASVEDGQIIAREWGSDR